MLIQWAYDEKAKLDKLKYVGKEIKAIKQLFSAFLYREGVQGVAVSIASVSGNPKVEVRLIADEIVKFRSIFSPTLPDTYIFSSDGPIIAKKKIEIELEVTNGEIGLKISSIGVGMGFMRKEDSYVPTMHMSIGLITN